jgi:Opioid growth factor receptor (OGFr) conserved region
MSSAQGDRLINFYSGKSSDDAGRMIEDIWRFSFSELEETHDYIQWLFPLRTRSAFNPDAPTLKSETITVFHADSNLRDRVRRSLEVMLTFYGLELDQSNPAQPVIQKSKSFPARSVSWLQPYDHNHLRLTRILTSLRLLGLPELSVAFYRCLQEIVKESPERVASETVAFWAKTQD